MRSLTDPAFDFAGDILAGISSVGLLGHAFVRLGIPVAVAWTLGTAIRRTTLDLGGIIVLAITRAVAVVSVLARLGIGATCCQGDRGCSC
ncbi:MAG TPA: hypothetical protein DEP68_10815 [Erythrobacter sp.]|nr:hypothetical protein [Sphingomonadaceae bacterium]MBG74706.1 hypothetical protein [Erythrobacteraceae bacterium]HAD18203.1 hypothetical protein [Erythrobacter sp.]HCB79244.1 hypothetical protein [Erythrobacter sp.]